jgi:hypothetical protein
VLIYESKMFLVVTGLEEILSRARLQEKIGANEIVDLGSCVDEAVHASCLWISLMLANKLEELMDTLVKVGGSLALQSEATDL